MRRYLVSTSEGARHPFRRSVPAAVLRTRQPAEDTADLRLFGRMFVGSFVATLIFLG